MSLGTAFYRGADAVVLVFDVNVAKTFENVTRWHEEFFSQTDENPKEFPVVLIGNKIDLEQRAVRSTEIQVI